MTKSISTGMLNTSVRKKVSPEESKRKVLVYESPSIEVTHIKLEKGFAASSDEFEDGGTWE